MGHALQERYSAMVLAKLRKELVLKDGIVFNTYYEGDPKAGAVKVPKRDTEVAVRDYNTATGLDPQAGATEYVTVNITKDVGVNEIIDGYEAAAVPDGMVAERLDSAGYSLAAKLDSEGGAKLLAGATEKELAAAADATNIYDTIVDVRTQMSKANVPNDNRRYLLVTPDTLALILKDTEHFIRASELGDDVVQAGIIGRIAGFNVIEWNDSTANLVAVAGHPEFATRVNEWSVPVKLQDLSQSGKWIGASAVQGRMVFDHAVTRKEAIIKIMNPGG